MLYVLLCIWGIAQAAEIDRLLNEYSQKNNLSQKTIDENKGHLVLFTRERLERMHAKTLKDVFKTTPAIYYHENRYGLPDPLTSGAFEPYRSNFIRLYIDGVEITQGWASGLMLYGDMNIDFVDHIEFYYAIPSFETSVEPAYLTIFLYSKSPKQDAGTKIDLAGGSRGYNSQSISYGAEEDDISYMVNLSHTNAKRETVDNGTATPLHRDFERTQLFAYLKSENQTFHLQVMRKNTDNLAGLSWDATPLASQTDYLNLHMDYGVDFDEHWHAQFAFDWLHTDMVQEDDTPLFGGLNMPITNTFDGSYKNSTYGAELTYRKSIDKHRIAAGIKWRLKSLDSFANSGEEIASSPFTEESISSVFLQDQYALSDHELLTAGASCNHFSRDGAIADDDLLQLRLGYIYTSGSWSYKTYLYRTQFALGPSSRYLRYSADTTVKPQTTVGITQELAYQAEEYRLRLILLMMKDKNGLLENMGAGETKYFFSILNYDYNFDRDNKLNLQLYYAQYEDIFDYDKLEDYSGYLSITNSYKDFDFYNGVVWHQNSLDWKNYFDLTSTISWNINKDMTLTLKGQNLLDRAKKTDIFRLDPSSGSILEPLKVSPIDRRVTFELEYTF